MATETFMPLGQHPTQTQQTSQRKLMAPQPPVPPEIEGYLKKLKRKTSSLSGSWNKRWFFVDPRRREFGYAANKAPNAPRSSIFLDDITAVVQFDDTHFQVESRTRNFFLCGESKASTCCWVSTLDEYRKKLAAYEKEKTAYLAACKLLERESEQQEAALVTATAKSLSVSTSVKKEKSEESAARTSQERERSHSKKEDRKPTKEEPRRDSSSSSLGSRSSSSASSSTGRSPSGRSRDSKTTERRQKSRREARRSPSPTSTPEPSPPPPSRSTYGRNDRPPRIPNDRGVQRGRGGFEREVERERSRGSRGRGRGRESWRDECDEDDDEEEDIAAGESVVEITASSSRSRGRGGRGDGLSRNPSKSVSRGHIVQAWIDEDFD